MKSDLVKSKVMRKGAWTKEEDMMLEKCIHKYGEGKWHLVPSRAALNRCRKSCRLRWLNYLKPDIKKGQFTEDEVDLVLRLHKLLGNRWSLIAGRIPGRTANDIKNYWNTHLRKKIINPNKPFQNHKTDDKISQSNSNKIIKPRPRKISKQPNNDNDVDTTIIMPFSMNNCNVDNVAVPPNDSLEELKNWWDIGLDFDEGITSSDVHNVLVEEEEENNPIETLFADKTKSSPSNLAFDLDLWELDFWSKN